MSLLTTDYILTIAIFSHGCENLLEPFQETDPVGQFYRNNVRVFSQSCVPDIPSITTSNQHDTKAKTIREHIQSNPPTADTYSILEPYITSCNPKYMNIFTEEQKALHPEFDNRLFEPKYIDKTCGIMVYLANKTFGFYGDDPSETSPFLFGIVLLDIRIKKTYDDGSIKYERVFDPPPRNNSPILLSSYDGLNYLLKTVLHKPPNKILTSMGFSKKVLKLNTIDLIKLYELFELCGIRYVNILDYSCRSCQSQKSLSSDQIDKLYQKEQEISLLLPKFGGKYK